MLGSYAKMQRIMSDFHRWSARRSTGLDQFFIVEYGGNTYKIEPLGREVHVYIAGGPSGRVWVPMPNPRILMELHQVVAESLGEEPRGVELRE
jgi:hypothetical protein